MAPDRAGRSWSRVATAPRRCPRTLPSTDGLAWGGANLLTLKIRCVTRRPLVKCQEERRRVALCSRRVDSKKDAPASSNAGRQTEVRWRFKPICGAEERTSILAKKGTPELQWPPLCRLTFDMRGGRKQAKLACGRPLDGRVRCGVSIGCIGCSPGLSLRDWKSPNPQSTQEPSPNEQP